MTIAEIGKSLAIVLAVVLALSAAMSVREWYLTAYRPAQLPPPDSRRVQYPNAHRTALGALDAFRELPAGRRAAIRDALRRSLPPVATWTAQLQRAGFSLLCLGENHDEYTRRFMARRLFAALDFDALLLEATPDGMARITDELRDAEPYIPLLDADIGAVLRAARARNPDALIAGIEETERQRRERGSDPSRTRDHSIHANLVARALPGGRTIALLGALHCSNRAGWLFDLARSAAAPADANSLTNAGVFGEHQMGPLEAFVYFLDEIGVETGDFVIAETSSISPEIRAWFPILTQDLLDQFRTVIVFRP